MRTIASLLSGSLTTERFDRRLGSIAALVAAPVLFTLGVLAVARFAATPGEVVSGVLSACAAALSLAVLGTVLDRRR